MCCGVCICGRTRQATRRGNVNNPRTIPVTIAVRYVRPVASVSFRVNQNHALRALRVRRNLRCRDGHPDHRLYANLSAVMRTVSVHWVRSNSWIRA